MKHKTAVLLGLMSASSVAIYLIVSYQYYGIGFPLDDSWIHQTYARNLVQTGQWSFFPGQPSAGSTSPVWVVMLSIGYMLGLGPYIVTFLLGWLILWGLAVLSVIVFRLMAPNLKKVSIWVGIIMTLEWHLVWAAVSGMETLLFTLAVMGVFAIMFHLYEDNSNKNTAVFILGLLIGFSSWIRPEGITLMAAAGAGIWFSLENKSNRITAIAILGAGFVLIFGPYLIFNQFLAGDWWPNTFYAKQAEYNLLLEAPLLQRYLNQLSLPLVGIGIALLPGVIRYIYQRIRTRKWFELLPTVWLFAHMGLYAIRLPVTYQHGRYIIPVMPLFFLVGLIGTVNIIKPQSHKAWKRVLSRAWMASTGLLLVAFWWLGTSAYARDVAVIETEMVATAKWVSLNTSDIDVIAAHDIGALGYFAGRNLLDLAGLVSPDVVPFIRDEVKISEYLDMKAAKYLIAFPSQYPYLMQFSTKIYHTNAEFSPMLGGENMTVYLWALP